MTRALSIASALAGTLIVSTVLGACGAGLGRMLYGDRTGNFAGQRPSAPTVRLVETRLVHAPTNEQLGLHYCQIYASRSPAGPFGALACRALGPLPTREDLQFTFDVEMEAANPGRVPLPMVEALVAFRAFPESGDTRNLGTVCLSLCEDPARCPQGRAGACQSDEPEIRDLESFATAAAGFLVSVALGQRRFEDLRVRTIAPNDRLRFVASLSLDVDQALSLIERVAGSAVQSAQRGQTPRFDIPYEVEGSVFVEVEGFGRFAASFPAASGHWDLAALAGGSTPPSASARPRRDAW
ncbi:MAG: hypothetical protein OHK0013_26750 [Sandaracinaceae bacterium]